MTKLFLGNSVWNLIWQADIVAKFVLLFLLGLSILCWAIFFYKLILFRIKRKQLREVRKAMKNVSTFEQLIDVASEYSNTLPGYFLTRNLTFLKSLLSTEEGKNKRSLTYTELELMQQHVDQVTDDVLASEESFMPILSTTAAVAPLVGLFGTVWGLVHAFIRIGEQESADIATVAPGIAGALMTTLAGLVVAIPAFIMFSYCASQVRKLGRDFLAISDQFVVVVQRLMTK